MRTLLLVVAALAQFGCAHARLASQAAACDIGGSPIAESDTSACPAALAGTFTLVRDYLERPGVVLDSTKLVLALASPEQRAFARSQTSWNPSRPSEIPNSHPRALWLSGRWIWSEQYRPFAAEVVDGRTCLQGQRVCGSWNVVLGCSNCFDGSPTYLYPTRVGAKGFAGEWINYNTGIAQPRKGQPRSEGDFCAIRDAS